MKTIRLSQDKVAIVDDKDFERVSQFKWHLSRCKRSYYAKRSIKINGRGATVLLHRFILGLRPGDPDVDHANRDGLNNHRSNLRLATKRQNMHNRRKTYLRSGHRTSSKYKGVCWHRHIRKWAASIRVNGKLRHLGYFASEIKAAATYDRAAVRAFGKYARINFSSEV